MTQAQERRALLRDARERRRVALPALREAVRVARRGRRSRLAIVRVECRYRVQRARAAAKRARAELEAFLGLDKVPGEVVLGGRRPSERQREFDAIVDERDECYRRMQDAEKKIKSIAVLVSIYDRQDEPEGQVSARRALTAIAETIGQQCSICRSRHGAEVQHACE